MSKKKRKHGRRSGRGGSPPRAPIYGSPKPAAAREQRANLKPWIIGAVVVLAAVVGYAKFGPKGNGSKPSGPPLIAAPAAKPAAAPAPAPGPAPVTGPRAQFASTTYDFGKANG